MKIRIEYLSMSEKSVYGDQYTMSMEIRSGCLWRLKTRVPDLANLQICRGGASVDTPRGGGNCIL